LASATLTFFSATGVANRSTAMRVPPRVIESVFRPAPESLTLISSGALPMTSASGVTRICGGCVSKRARQ
jgi:hypothetical protein